MKNTGVKGFTVIVVLLALSALAYYAHLSSKGKSVRDEKSKNEAETLLQYDFSENYPKTVRETVKLHCRYLKCAYNEGFTDEELVTVNKKIRELFDNELLMYNTEQSQLQGLRDEIALYKKNKQKIASYSLEEGSQIKYNTDEDGNECAKMEVDIVLKVGSSSVMGSQEYILRKDKLGNWKILGWKAIKKNEAEGDKN